MFRIHIRSSIYLVVIFRKLAVDCLFGKLYPVYVVVAWKCSTFPITLKSRAGDFRKAYLVHTHSID